MADEVGTIVARVVVERVHGRQEGKRRSNRDLRGAAADDVQVKRKRNARQWWWATRAGHERRSWCKRTWRDAGGSDH